MSWSISRTRRASLSSRLVGAFPIALAVALAGCGGSSMQVNTDFDPAANFTGFKTYAWRAGTKLPNPLSEQRVIAAVDAQLKAKGLTRVDSAGDITVTYHAAADKSVDVQTYQSGGYYGCWGGCMGTTSTTVTPVTVGTLIVDVIDTKSNKMIWRGTGTDTVSPDPNENAQKINEAIQGMFQNFPPKK